MEDNYFISSDMALSTITTDDALPPHLAAALPGEPEARLQCAELIVRNAFTLQASMLEGSLSESRAEVQALRRRNAALEDELRGHQQWARQSAGEQQQLAAEKAALIETVKRLNREVARLEQFRRNLLRQLQDDGGHEAADASPASLVAVDVTTERLVQDVLSGCKGAAPDQSAPAPLAPPAERLALPDGGGRGAGGAGKAALGAAKGGAGAPAADVGGRGGGGGGGGGVDQRAGPLAHAGGLGDAASGGRTHDSPPEYGRQRQQQRADGFAAPPGAPGGQGDGGAAAASGSPRVDGREFFRACRSRLSYEAFSAFLSHIKELNAGRATREETLARARGLFGAGSGDLYELFEGLLSRHLTA